MYEPCPSLLATPEGVYTVWHLRRACYLLPVNGVGFFHRQLIRRGIFLQLILGIRCYLLCVLPDRVYLVAAAPEFPIPIPESHIPPLLVDHQAAFAFEIPHKA